MSTIISSNAEKSSSTCRFSYRQTSCMVAFGDGSKFWLSISRRLINNGNDNDTEDPCTRRRTGKS